MHYRKTLKNGKKNILQLFPLRIYVMFSRMLYESEGFLAFSHTSTATAPKVKLFLACHFPESGQMSGLKGK